MFVPLNIQNQSELAFKKQSNIYSIYDYTALMIKIMLQMFMWELSNAEKVQKEVEKNKDKLETDQKILYM